jgi:[ribosomal protein S5]-alanine N-acetyltransferase
VHIILETPRLILRQLTEADVPLLLQLNGDPEVLKYLHEPALKTEMEALNILRNHIFPQYKSGLGRWATITKEGNEFIGWCGLKFRPELDEIDLGYRFMQQHWGKGYATESAQHCLDYGLKQLNLETITGRAHIENTASQKVLEKIGMKFVKEEFVDECPVKTYIAVSN